MRPAALICLAFATAAAAAPSRLIIARGAWASFDRGQSCEAVAKPLAPVKSPQVQPYVAIAFDRAGPRHGQFFAQLRRPARPGSSVMLTVGDQPFLLAARGAAAWSSGFPAGSGDHRRHAQRRRHAGRRPRFLPAGGSSTAIASTARPRRSTRPPRPAPAALEIRRHSHYMGAHAMSADTALMPIPGPVDPVPVPRAARAARRRPGRAGRPAQGRDPRRARRGRARAQAGQAARQADLALDLQSRRQRFRGDDRHRQGAAPWLAERFAITRPEVVEAQVSTDGTRKWLLTHPRRP